MTAKYKKRNPYKPLRFAQGVARAFEVCPRWRMVTAVGRGWWSERRHDGSHAWNTGDAPMQAGVVCDDAWCPAMIETHAGRVLPVLAEEWEDG